MNLWLRLVLYLLRSRWRPALVLPGDASVMHMRAGLLDLDVSMHVNNGRYLALMDLGRLDLMVGGGLWRAVVRERWTPIAGAVAIRFRREIRLFQRFRLETRIVGWDATAVVIEQTFRLEGGARDGDIAARALFKGGLYDRKARAFVPLSRLMAEVGVAAEPPAMTPEVAAFLATDQALR